VRPAKNSARSSSSLAFPYGMATSLAAQVRRATERDAREAVQAAGAERASAQLDKADRQFAFILADPPTIWEGGQGRATPLAA
jgi:hypothetical protein